jgi:hypothetical protein
MRTLLTLVVALAGTLARADAPPPRAPGPPRILHDFAHPLAATLPAAEREAALTRAFPVHLGAADACRPTAKRERVPGHMRKTVCFPGPGPGLPACEAEIDVPQPELDRRLGNLVPSLLAFARGSFSRPRADELALWIAPGYCSDRARSLPPRLFVLDGERVVLDLEHAPNVRPEAAVGYDFVGLAAKDVDGDGQHELLFEVQYYATMDVTRSDAYLVRLRDGRAQLVAAFPGVFETRCATYYEPGERYKRAAIIRYLALPTGPSFLPPGDHDLGCDTGAPR